MTGEERGEEKKKTVFGNLQQKEKDKKAGITRIAKFLGNCYGEKRANSAGFLRKYLCPHAHVNFPLFFLHVLQKQLSPLPFSFPGPSFLLPRPLYPQSKSSRRGGEFHKRVFDTDGQKVFPKKIGLVNPSAN